MSLEKQIKFNISYDQHGVLRSQDVEVTIEAEDEESFNAQLQSAVDKLFAASSIRLDDNTWSKINVLQVHKLEDAVEETGS